MIEKTLMIIKPDAIKKRKIGAILDIIESNGFDIIELKMFHMNKNMAEQLYAVHQGKSYYNKLIDFMITSNVVAVILQRENAISKLRSIVGNTDPAEAAMGTIRHIYGNTVSYNAVHAADSPKNAEEEITIVFPELKQS
ncbi:MAG: nucleoside-diphosphate kinase [Candidatus Cloacimonetes bacterium]|nr:nucleoside-diphosphate kinase [Candidatus Cloacimonadota bacterium]